MIDKQIKYLFAENTGIELIKCENSCLSYPLHNHVSVVTFGMILSGNIQISLRGKTTYITENQTFVIPPYVPHSINATSKYTMISLCVRKEIVEQVNMNNLFSMAVYLIDKAFLLNQINTEQMILFLDAISLYKCHTHTHTFNADYVENLKRLIELYPEYNLTIEEMARQVFISKYHLIRSFKQEIGLTPHQFQIQNRVRKAQRLLNQSLSITEVALTAGFFDQSHLIRNFEKIVGLSPTGYKSACQLVQVP